MSMSERHSAFGARLASQASGLFAHHALATRPAYAWPQSARLEFHHIRASIEIINPIQWRFALAFRAEQVATQPGMVSRITVCSRRTIRYWLHRRTIQV